MVSSSVKVALVPEPVFLYYSGVSMRLADCSTQMFARILVHSPQNKELHLTAFENVLLTVILGDFDSLTEADVAEVLLLLEDITVTYNSTSMVITKLL